MSPRVKADRMTLSVGISVACIALFSLYWIVHFWMLRQDYVESIEKIVPMTARLQGIVDNELRLTEAATRVDGVLAELAYPGARDTAMTAAGMQQQVRDVIAAAGLSVAGSQILPAYQISGFERMILDITATGSIASLEEAIVSLKELRPLVLIETVTIKPVRQRRVLSRKDDAAVSSDQRQLSVRMRLLSLRLLPL